VRNYLSDAIGKTGTRNKSQAALLPTSLSRAHVGPSGYDV
jgi:hypothetical protein